MATEDEGTPTGEHTAPAGGKHKSKTALLAGKHRDQILVASSVLLVVLAWLSLRKTSSSATAASGAGYLSPTTAAQAGLGSAGAVGGYDASAMQGLQTLLANQSDQLSTLESAVSNLTGAGSSTPTSTPSALSSPIAAGLFAPSSSGQFVRYADGGLFQVQSDGSLFGETLGQNADAVAHAQQAGSLQWTQLSGSAPTSGIFTTQDNLARVAARNAG